LTFSDVLTVYVSLVSVAVLSSYLARRFEVVGELAREQAKHLSQLRGERRGIFEDLSEGIVLLNENGRVAEFSPSVRTIFGWTEQQAASFRGQSFRNVLESLVCPEDRSRLPARFDDEIQWEFRAGSADQNNVRHFSLSSRPVSDASGGEKRGAVVVLSDKSHERSIEERLRLHEKMAELLAEQPRGLSGTHLKLYFADMAGESMTMRRVFELVERVAGSNASVLIEGESGTGKELIAKAIHQRGARSGKPFVAINCGALPENLIESELFGHRRGAFTGASQDSAGLFRQAQGGTLFLDEIGELPLHLQTKLLRVLQEKAVRAVGDTKDYQVDVRVLAATNRDLRSEVHAGRFREDLYYRLNVVNISVPPLRERREDIPLLIRHFFSRLCHDRAFPQVSPEALQLLMQYPFPGNIRELENIIERALVLGGTAILPEHLPDEVRRRSDGAPHANGDTQFITLPIDLERALETLERAYLLRALSESNGVKKVAAEMLGLNFRSFRYRLKKYSLASENGAGGLDDEGEEEHSSEL
jgi:two-component system response regulator PilR (NtrC family)